MAQKEIKNMGESVRNRLLNISKASKRNFNAVLLQYAQERFLYRLSKSKYNGQFVLKGGLLFLAYQMPSQRPTKDISFLAQVWDFKPRALRQSILKTFKARGVNLNESEKIFLPEYAANNAMQAKWSHFEKRMNIKSLSNFKDTMEKVKLFLEPIVQKDEMGKTWDKEKWKWVV